MCVKVEENTDERFIPGKYGSDFKPCRTRCQTLIFKSASTGERATICIRFVFIITVLSILNKYIQEVNAHRAVESTMGNDISKRNLFPVFVFFGDIETQLQLHNMERILLRLKEQFRFSWFANVQNINIRTMLPLLTGNVVLFEARLFLRFIYESIGEHNLLLGQHNANHHLYSKCFYCYTLPYRVFLPSSELRKKPTPHQIFCAAFVLYLSNKCFMILLAANSKHNWR